MALPWLHLILCREIAAFWLFPPCFALGHAETARLILSQWSEQAFTALLQSVP